MGEYPKQDTPLICAGCVYVDAQIILTTLLLLAHGSWLSAIDSSSKGHGSGSDSAPGRLLVQALALTANPAFTVLVALALGFCARWWWLLSWM